MIKRISLGVLCLLFIANFAAYQRVEAQTEASRPAPEISYTVSMSKPWTHLLEVAMRLKSNQMPDQTEIKMPVWTPGSYLIREYARHVQDFVANDASGRELKWAKINKNTWQLETKGVRDVVIKYRVYANELTVRTNELTDEHAFWNNGALLMFPKGQLRAPSTVRVIPYSNWKIATGLPKTAEANTFRAENYDILYDSPFEVSNFNEIEFTVLGKKHRFVMSGEGNYDLKQIAADTTKIIEESYKIFGDLPYDDYTFIVNLRGGGGLEHLNSTALQWNRFGFQPRSQAIAFAGLVAHEYFHLWNVKRIRPEALGPFDYENENYTKSLWVAEGITSYYANLILQRAGFASDGQFFDEASSGIMQLQSTPGRFETSLEDASMDAWIKGYRPDENSLNNQISYYSKGETVGMLLDIKIRTESGGTKSLDSVMRHLYDEFYKKGKNYTPADFQKVSEMMAGKSLDDFFAKYVRGTDEIDYNSILNGIGLSMSVSKGNGKGDLGAGLMEEDGKLTVRSLPAGSPAYEQGLNVGDQIVAVDGYRASRSFVQTAINGKKPQDKIRLTIFHLDKLREVEITLGEDSRRGYLISPNSSATPEQKQLYSSYMTTGL